MINVEDKDLTEEHENDDNQPREVEGYAVVAKWHLGTIKACGSWEWATHPRTKRLYRTAEEARDEGDTAGWMDYIEKKTFEPPIDSKEGQDWFPEGYTVVEIAYDGQTLVLTDLYSEEV